MSTLQDDINRYWNLRWDSYDAQPRHDARDDAERGAWHDDLADLLPPAPGQALDVGAGTGFLSIVLATLGYQVTGLEPAENMLAAARKKAAGVTPAPVWHTGDGHAPPFPDHTFDIVASRHVLWTLRDPDRAFSEWLRVLRPGGSLLAIDSLWFLEGDPADPDKGDEPWRQAWRDLYSPQHQAQLPLMQVASLEPAMERLRATGFQQVTLRRLQQVEALDRNDEQTSGRGPVARYAITAVRRS